MAGDSILEGAFILMKVVIQRVTQGRVTVAEQTVGQCGPGLVILVGAGQGDGQAEAEQMAQKIAHLRIFSDAEGKTNLSILDVDGEALVISQFTLYADCRKGRRPSFVHAAPPEIAEPLVEFFAEQLRKLGIRRVETGVFGAMMMVEIHNDGPFTIVLDSDDLKR
jgi:D-tyrosyl-tRNA(Tyr) deacylase